MQVTEKFDCREGQNGMKADEKTGVPWVARENIADLGWHSRVASCNEREEIYEKREYGSVPGFLGTRCFA